MNLVLVLLEPDQPPTADAHTQNSDAAAQDHAGHKRNVSATCEGDESASPSSHGQQSRQENVTWPGLS